MLKVAVIGCGLNCDRHINVFGKMDDASITALCDVVPEKLEDAVKKTGANGYLDYNELLEKEELDLVIINLPHALHNPCVQKCAAKGIDIYLEKPMGISVADCQEMIDVCEKAGVLFWIGHGQGYFPTNSKAKEIVKSGKLGELVGITETRNCFYFSPARPRWFLDKKMSGGGIMMNLGAHALDKVKYFSDGEIVEAVGSVHIPEGASVEDGVQAFVKTSTGVSALLNLTGHTTAGVYQTVLYLSKGEIRIRDGEIEVFPMGEEGEVIDCRCGLSEMDFIMKEVVDTLKTRKTPTVDGAYGLDVIRAIQTIYKEI